MTTDVTEQRTPLLDHVIEEIRVWMTRRRMSGRKLAAALGVSQTYVSTRLTGVTPMDLIDLERFASALDVEVTDLLPPARNREGRLITTASPAAEPGRTSNARSSRATGRPRLDGRPPRTTQDQSTVRPVRLRELTGPR